jgi:hypothetical protein
VALLLPLISAVTSKLWLVQTEGFELLLALPSVGSGLVVTLALALVFIFGVWGMIATGRAVLDEVAEMTWDQQRLIHTNAWSLLWGKWLGSSLYQWYVITICTGVAVVFGAKPWDLAFYLLFILLFQTLGLGTGLAGAMRCRQLRRPTTHNTAALVAGGLVLLGLFNLLLSDQVLRLPWWLPLPPDQLRVLWLALWLPWPILLAHRLTRLELQERVSPLPFFLFVAFVAGFFDPATQKAGRELLPLAASSLGMAGVAGAVAYTLSWLERVDERRWRWLAELYQTRSWSELWLSLPLGWFCLPICLAACISGVYLAGPSLLGWTASLLLFLVRDWTVTLIIQLRTPTHRDPWGMMVFVFALLYLFLPLVTSQIAVDFWRGFFLPSQEQAWKGLPGALLAIGLLVWQGRLIGLKSL